jgi:hypothetical protein
MADQVRWWEQYYVRYFVGTAAAVPFLVWLAQRQPVAGVAQQIPANAAWLTAGAIATGGLAYCYVSSAPILLVHALRRGLPRSEIAHGIIVWGILLLCMGLFAATLYSSDNPAFPPFVKLLPYSVVVAGQCIALVLGVQWRQPQPQSGTGEATQVRSLVDYYVRLATSRSAGDPRENSSTPRSEYVESYRHLREHGNAMSIVLAEIVLTVALMWANTVPQLILLVSIWVLPSTIAWILGTWLEQSIDEAPDA